MGEENFVPTTSDKTPAQTLRIMDGVNKNELLSGRAPQVERGAAPSGT